MVISIFAFDRFVSNWFKNSLWISTVSYSLTECFEHTLKWGTVMAFVWHFLCPTFPWFPILFSLKCRIIWLTSRLLQFRAVYNVATWKRTFLSSFFFFFFFCFSMFLSLAWTLHLRIIDKSVWKRCMKKNLYGPSCGKKRVFLCSFECRRIIYAGAMFWRDKILPTVLHANLCNVNINSCCTCIIKDIFIIIVG